MNPSVALIDTLKQNRFQLQAIVSRHLQRRQVQATVRAFSSPEEFLASYRPGVYSILVLGADAIGMRLAENIYRSADHCQIVFTAADAAHALQGYEVEAAGFILEPIQPCELERALDRCLKRLKIPPSIEVVANRLPTRVSLDSILWLNTFHNTIVIHTDAGEIKTYMTFERIKDLLEQADSEGRFLMCYTGCLVNMDRIRSTGENDFLMVNGDRVQIRRRGCGLIRRAYVQYRCGMRDVATAG